MVDMNEVFTKYKIEDDIRLMDHFLEETICRPYDIAEYLRDWYNAKNEYLFDLFGDKLIIDCGEIEFNLTDDEILSMVFDDLELDKLRNDFYYIVASLLSKLLFDKVRRNWLTNPHGCEDPETAEYVDQLLNCHQVRTLIDNNFAATTKAKATFTAADGHKEYAYIHKGQKVSKIWNNFFKTIEKAYPTQYTEKIEEARKLCQQILAKLSMYVGRRKTTGRLKLSIHPFDYITMSQNNCDWWTCLSFTDKKGEIGDYCAGAMAMMNSKNTIVAYLEADTPFYPCYVGPYRNTTWNNKKYRNLIVVDPLVISAIKGYPRIIDAVDEIIINKVAELCTTNLKWTFDMLVNTPHFIRRVFNDVPIYFTTQKMYNDALRYQAQYMTGQPSNLNITPTTAFWDKTNFGIPAWELVYDGKVKCLDCGRDIENSDHPLCFHCEGLEQCEGCGTWGGSYDMITSEDGSIYCSDCYCERKFAEEEE